MKKMYMLFNCLFFLSLLMWTSSVFAQEMNENTFSVSRSPVFQVNFVHPTADKPQMACLSSRIPTGEPVTVEKPFPKAGHKGVTATIEHDDNPNAD